MNNKRLSGLALATAAAMAFSSAPLQAADAPADTAKVRCEGVNNCKGQSACSTAKNGCAGQNQCKGQGYLELTKAECDAAKAKKKS
jgi:uncharacterized membrane protein